jgi:hypothetical protein
VGVYGIPATRGADDPGFNKFLKCDTTGVTGTTEPVWTTGANQTDGTARWDYIGAPSIDGFPVEEIIQNILDDNFPGSAPTLNVPTSPLWNITQFLQQREPVLDAIIRLAAQIGWDLRQRWSGTEFKLTLYEPERESPSVDHVFSPSDYGEPQKLAVDISSIRNKWKVIIKDRDDLWPDGTPKRKEFTAEDEDSIEKYGGPNKDPLYAEIQESETGNVDTPTEANRLLAAAVSDCAEPDAELSVPLMQGFPWVELNDYYTFSADNVRFSSDQSLAVTSWEQVFEDGHLHTELELRGKPTIGSQRHLEKIAHPANPERAHAHREVHFQGQATPKLDTHAIVGGFEVQIQTDKDKNALLAEYEIHVSTSSGFTPDDTTIVAVMTGNQMSVPYQNPGQDYYACAVPRWYNKGELVRGQPSKRKLVTAGRAVAGHLEQGPRWGRQPLNGGFETKHPNSIAGSIADHWSVIAGSAYISEGTGSGGISGERFLIIDLGYSGSAPDFRSDVFQVESGRQYRASWWFDNHEAATDAKVQFYIKLYSDAAATTEVDEQVIDTADMVNDTSIQTSVWRNRGAVFTVDVDARYARVGFRVSDGAAASKDFYIDSVEVQPWDVTNQAIVRNGTLSATTTSSTFATLNSFTADQKECGGQMLGFVNLSCYSTGGGVSSVEVRLKVTGIEGDTTTSSAIQFTFNNQNVHHAFGGVVLLNRPRTAGSFTALLTVAVEWRRLSGTGTITVDSGDTLSYGVI